MDEKRQDQIDLITSILAEYGLESEFSRYDVVKEAAIKILNGLEDME